MFIDIKNARKHYGDGETLVNALDGVSLSLGEGKIYVILGPSGSGKSTLLNMIGPNTLADLKSVNPRQHQI